MFHHTVWPNLLLLNNLSGLKSTHFYISYSDKVDLNVSVMMSDRVRDPLCEPNIIFNVLGFTS